MSNTLFVVYALIYNERKTVKWFGHG